jgi:hypothetical protein
MDAYIKTSPKEKFETKLSDALVTEAEKEMFIQILKEIGIDDLEAYKISAIERYTGKKLFDEQSSDYTPRSMR